MIGLSEVDYDITKAGATTRRHRKTQLYHDHYSMPMMNRQLPETAFINLLRQCYFRPCCHSQAQCRTLRTLHRVPQPHKPTSPPVSGLHPADEFLDGSPGAGQALRNTSTNLEKKDLAVLGGGITGLTSAYYLAKNMPNAKITIYEGSERLGGWLRTKHVDVGNGNVVFEQGPRTLRPSMPVGLVTLDLVRGTSVGRVGTGADDCAD